MAKNALDKIFSFVETEIKKKKAYSKIGDHCFNFIHKMITPMLTIPFMPYDTNDSKNHFYNQTVPLNDTWVEIEEPAVINKERAANTLVRVKKVTKEIKDVENVIKYVSIENTRSDDKGSSSTKKESKKNTVRMMKHQFTKSFEAVTTDEKKIPLIDLPCYDIPIEKFKPKEEPKENEELRKLIQIEFKKRDEMNRINEEIAKRQKKLLFEARIKKDIDFNKYTFDSNGEIMPVKKFNIDNIGLGNEFYWSKALIKDCPISIKEEAPKPGIMMKNTKDSWDMVSTKTNKVTTDGVIRNSSISDNDTIGGKEYKMKHKVNKNSFFASGSNFDLIEPEIGVVIHEEDKSKSGSKNFIKKYNKTSIYDYSRLLNESMVYNENMVKRGVISEIPKDSVDNSREEQPYYGYKEKIISSNNPLVENATKQLSLPIISISGNDLAIKPSMISTQSNPLLANSYKSYIYKGGSEEDRITINNNNSVKDLQKALEIDEPIHNHKNSVNKSTNNVDYFKNMSLKRNKSELGEMFKESFKKYYKKKKENYEMINKFNSALVKNDGYAYYFNMQRRRLVNFRKFTKGDKVKELGQKIVNVKMPRERRFNLNQYTSNKESYALMHKRSESVKHF